MVKSNSRARIPGSPHADLLPPPPNAPHQPEERSLTEEEMKVAINLLPKLMKRRSCSIRAEKANQAITAMTHLAEEIHGDMMEVDEQMLLNGVDEASREFVKRAAEEAKKRFCSIPAEKVNQAIAAVTYLAEEIHGDMMEVDDKNHEQMLLNRVDEASREFVKRAAEETLGNGV